MIRWGVKKIGGGAVLTVADCRTGNSFMLAFASMQGLLGLLDDMVSEAERQAPPSLEGMSLFVKEFPERF